MSGVKGRSGRKPNTPYTAVGKLELQKLDEMAVRVIRAKLLKGDKECAIFVYEQNHGKAKAITELQGSMENPLAISWVELLRALEARQARGIEQGADSEELEAEYSIDPDGAEGDKA